MLPHPDHVLDLLPKHLHLDCIKRHEYLIESLCILAYVSPQLVRIHHLRVSSCSRTCLSHKLWDSYWCGRDPLTTQPTTLAVEVLLSVVQEITVLSNRREFAEIIPLVQPVYHCRSTKALKM